MYKLLTLVSLSILCILTSCHSEKSCDFRLYVKNIPLLDSLSFKDAKDFRVSESSNSHCDSVYFGQGFYPAGRFDSQADFYSIILLRHASFKNEKSTVVSEPYLTNDLFIATISHSGHLIGRTQLKTSGMQEDSAYYQINYHIKGNGVVIKYDTANKPGHDASGEYTVCVAGMDTLFYKNKIPSFRY